MLRPLINVATRKAMHNHKPPLSCLEDFGKRRAHEKVVLSSYLNVCCDVGQVNRAHNTLIRHSRFKGGTIADITHYNAVLKGWAKLGSAMQVGETRHLMVKNSIEPNAETFAYILLAFSKNQPEARPKLRFLLQEMRDRHINPDTLFRSAYLSQSERHNIKTFLNGTIVKRNNPPYDDSFCPEPINYNCKLLNSIDTLEPVPYNCFGQIDLSSMKNLAAEQRSIETISHARIPSIDHVEQSNTQLAKYIKLWNVYRNMWRKCLTESLTDLKNTLKAQCVASDKVHLYPYLCTLDDSKIVEMMLDEVETNAKFSSFSVSTNTLYIDFGTRIMTRYLRAKSIADGSHAEKQKIYEDYINIYCQDPILMGRMNSREYIQTRAAETKNYSVYKDRISPIEEWPSNIVASIGKCLYRIIVRDIKFDPGTSKSPNLEIKAENLVHAFYTAYYQIESTHKMKEEFRSHQDFEKLYLRACSTRIKFDYNFLPTRCPPLPWLSNGFGGYLTHKSALVRSQLPSAETSALSNMHNCDYQKLYPSIDSLNALGLCPWIVNTEVLDIVIQLFRSGGDVDLGVPLNQAKMDLKAPVLEEGSKKDQSQRSLFKAKKKKYDQKRREMSSLRYDCLYRLSIANYFRDKVFWFPHNMDFRGRVYPIPPHFNHIGADLARSLLLFAKGRPLGEKGLDWLKIHLVNLVGQMKQCTIQERLNYANSILHSEVLDSADNPWDGRRWWTQNEYPWQVLACCKEIAKAIRSNDFKQYVSHFPIHQDGSCNGLQHYAALGRDTEGGQAVNLIPHDRPQDVYSRVVDIVEDLRQRDATNGSRMAESLRGFVQRKVIKQTVMTTVYGVTRFGARAQIARQLVAKGYPERELWKASHYLTCKTFEAISQMFNKSRAIQSWFDTCTYIIAAKYKQPISWETPLGFPIIQPYTVPYRTVLRRLIQTNSGSTAPIFNDPFSMLNGHKQRAAFPPNYIHSLDSSHMMLTSLFCQRQGITFVSVHDCFWTHPSTVDIMNRTCREQFVALHSEPLLEQLSEQFKAKVDWNVAESTKSKKIKMYPNSSLFESHPEIQIETDMQPLTPQQDLTHESDLSIDELVNEDFRQLIREHPLDGLGESECKELFLQRKLSQKHERAQEKGIQKDYAVIERVPELGDLDLKDVVNSTYFFC